MKRSSILLACAVLAVALASCAPKSDDGAASSSGSATASAAGGSGAADTGLPAGLDDGPRAAEEPIDEARATTGQGLFQTKGCSACHAFGKKVTGPDLAGASQRRTSKWLENQILHPDLMVKSDPIARQLFATHALQMPKQGLTPDEAKAVVEYLKHQDHEASESK